MSELDPDRVGFRPGRASEKPHTDLVQLLGPPFDRRRGPEREGLPPGYRMRADPHYVEELASPAPDASVLLVDVDDIDGGAGVEASDVRALARSIAEHGLLQPLLVRREGARYRVIAGARRLAAARVARLDKVPCVLRQVTAEQAALLAAASNAGARAASSPETAAPDPAVTTQLLAHLASELDAVERRSADGPGALDARLLEELSTDLAAIQSASTLLAVDGGSLVQRVAVDLLKTQAWRAAWLVRAAALVDGRPAAAAVVSRPLGAALTAVADGFQPESRIGGVEIHVEAPGWSVTAPIDEAAVVCGITGAVIATLGVLSGVKGATIRLSATAEEAGAVSVRVAQDAVALSADATDRFFDRGWAERPGGWLASLGASAARACAERHGGRAVLVIRSGAGSTLDLAWPSRRS